jgi:hypothetical protein
VILFEVRAWALSLKRLIGAMVGSVLGIAGVALFCMVLRSALPPTSSLSIIQIFVLLLMTYVGLLLGASRGEVLSPVALGTVLEPKKDSADTFFIILAGWKAIMNRKFRNPNPGNPNPGNPNPGNPNSGNPGPRNPNFDQTLESLRAHSFEITPYAAVAGGVLVSKYGAGTVLVAASAPMRAQSQSPDEAVAMAIAPGALLKGQVARLVDRGYQKFIKTSQFELPATASQLHAIHLFTVELKQLTGAINFYNESLGTTSDLYVYDRLKGREAAPPAPERPWEAAGAH